jgi:hypothetical protein
MKKFTRHFVVALFITGICAFTASDKWYVLEAKRFGFKVEFPVKPEEKTPSVNSEVGNLDMHLFIYDASKVKSESNLVYLANYTEYPDSAVNSGMKEKLKDIFRNSIDGAVSNVKGKLLSEKNVSIGGFEGREARIDFQDGMAVIRIRMFLVHNKMYMLETITETSKDNNASITKFMDSFKLIK